MSYHDLSLIRAAVKPAPWRVALFWALVAVALMMLGALIALYAVLLGLV